MQLIFASQNAGKIREIQSMLPAGMSIWGIDGIVADELAEDGTTFRDNALQKAKFIYEKTGLPTFAEDSGLEVDALHGEPGVFSARYAGEPKSDERNNEKLLRELGNNTLRTARFQTVIAFYDGTEAHFFTGSAEGKITLSPIGTDGFGYDPLFIPDGSEKTFGQMNAAEKKEFSHRAKAFKAFVAWLGKGVV